MEDTICLLKEITEAHGVPGYETPIRAIIRNHYSTLGDVSQDKIGSVICKKTGSSSLPKIMLAGHMDEIGFMVKYVTEEGFIKFLPLGGWFDQVLLGQRVIIKTSRGDIVGVIGAKPPHLLPPDERKKIVEKKDMYIDIGAVNRAEVDDIGIQPGDPIIPRADFVVLANQKTFLSKAFDDRVGVALIISLLQKLQDVVHPNTIYGVATVMEEVGIRGATTSVRAVDPDVAIVLEADIAGDVPGIKPEESAVKLGKGPSVLIYDARMIPNLKLRDFVIDIAKKKNIPHQVSYVEGGATDGAAIHLHHVGVPTVVVGIPARHIHSHGSIIHYDDYRHALELIYELVLCMDSEKVAEFTV